ncbi:hypothetical protein EYF80_053886 [Liparis tanakae]|uniref:Uncharacterized protein n=1 Tax=Liparis tanakae TaxID=230148 RepID=A0A4Z2F4C7_9TELE|nr:hypothetical protein EYF80_053886 [Liparis tanakae]
MWDGDCFVRLSARVFSRLLLPALLILDVVLQMTEACLLLFASNNWQLISRNNWQLISRDNWQLISRNNRQLVSRWLLRSPAGSGEDHLLLAVGGGITRALLLPFPLLQTAQEAVSRLPVVLVASLFHILQTVVGPALRVHHVVGDSSLLCRCGAAGHRLAHLPSGPWRQRPSKHSVCDFILGHRGGGQPGHTVQAFKDAVAAV